MSRMLEILWFIIAIFSFGLGIYQVSNYGIKESYQLFIISLVALSLFFLRKKLRKSSENKNK